MSDEATKRDQALDALAEHRAELIRRATAIAIELEKIHGSVTSVMVFGRMRELGIDVDDSVDPRWMGVVFRRGWRRVGIRNDGSHKRPVAVWERK